MPSRFLNNITVNDEYTLPSADGAENQIIVTDGAGNLSFDDLSTVTGKVEGVEANIVYYEVKNSTGTAIDTFKGVMAVGTDGNSGHILIDEMVADGSVEARYFLGITREAIPNGGIGRVISFGEIDQINTNAFPDGTVLWCDPANPGDFTATEPDGPNLKIPAAFVLNQATNGKIQVRVQGNEGIKDLYDTKITSQVDGDVLVWKGTEGIWQNDSTLNVDYANGRVGIETTSPGYKLDVAGDMNVGVNTGFTTTRLNFLEGFSYIEAANVFGTGSISMNVGSGEIYLSSNGNVGVGTSGPSQKLHVNGNGVFSGNVGIGTTSPQAKLHVANGTLRTWTPTSGTSAIFESTASNRNFLTLTAANEAELWFGNASTQTLGRIRYEMAVNNMEFWTNGTQKMVINASGNVGIGTASPGAKLDVLGFVNLGSSHTNYAGATYSVNMGFQNYNNGFAAIATGQGTLADASQSFSMGYQSKATGVASLAGGNVNTSTALPSESAGDASLAFGNGVKTNTNADFSQAFGRGTATGGGLTTANQAMAMGFGSIAYADNSFSGGNNSSAFGEASFAFGEGATASKGDGNVALGIGVTTPTTGTAAYGDGQVTVGKYNVYSTGVAHNFAVGTGSSDLTRKTDFCVTSAGDVGIGAISPGYKLDVAGDLRVDNGNVGSTSGDEVEHVKIQGARHFLKFKEVRTANDSDWKNTTFKIQAGVDATNHQSIDFVADGSYAEHIDIRTGNQLFNTRFTSTGNVGIGTTSPAKKLTIGGIGIGNTDGLKIEDPSNIAYGAHYSYDDGSTTVEIGGVVNNSLRDCISIARDATRTITIDTSERVGIGTTSPGQKLEVEGNIRISKSNDVTSGFELGRDGSTLDAFIIQRENADLFFRTNNSERMRIEAGGNVGIGATNPSTKLQVSGTVKSEGLDVDGQANSSTNFLQYTRTDSTQPASISYDATGGFDFNLNGGAVKFSDAGGGSVGIGTTSPGYNLDVSGNGNFNGDEFIVRNAPNTGGKIVGYFENAKDAIHLGDFDGVYAGSKLSIQYKNDIAEFFKMRVGIDNASPSYPLDVNGDGRVDGTFRCVSLIQTSQRDQKTEIQLVGKEATSIPIKRYKYKSGDNNKLRYGVVAEDIESTYPELVERDAEGVKGVKYIDLLVRKIAELETEKRTLVNWRHYHSNTSYNTLYDTGMTTAFPYAYGSIPAPYDMYFTSVTLVNNPYSSYNKGPLGDTAIFQAYVNGKLAYEVRDIRYGQNPYESITADFGQNVRLKRGESLQIRFYANGIWRYCNSTIILTEI